MTDIVERLIHLICACEKIGESDSASDFRDAKAEIERLRAQLALAKESIKCFEVDRVEATTEIERVREAEQKWFEQNAKLIFENQRLREKLAEAIREMEALSATENVGE